MSLGNKLGRSIGVLGALAVEGAVRGATGLGQFGSDVIDGAELGYTEKHAALLITREQAKADRDARIAAAQAEHKVAMKPVTAGKRGAKAAV
jgi:hypothetical protein